MEKNFLSCGLTIKEFDFLFDCLEPFTDLLIYPDCLEKDNKTNFNNRKLDRKTELLAALTIARHNVDLKLMGKLVGPSDSTMSRIFVAWMTLIRCVFDCIDPAPLPGFIKSFLPKKFVDAGYAECGILGDNTETWVSQFENFDTNNLKFSHYKIIRQEKSQFGFFLMVHYASALMHILDQSQMRKLQNKLEFWIHVQKEKLS